MSSYRVEVSPNNRAGCQDALCKKNGVKIMKGEIRFGVWVEGTSAGGHEFQSWRWRHWGCVSGKTLQNIRDNLMGPIADGGEYKWENLDGLEEMPSEYQERIKLAITEGKIADEDWKGDPAYNVLGKTGIRGHATTNKKTPVKGEEDGDKDPVAESPVKTVSKKRSRDEGEDKEAKTTKKHATKATRGNEIVDEAKPARNPTKKKAGKNEEEVVESKSIKKPRARTVTKKGEEISNMEAIKEEPDDKMEVNARPTRKSRATKGGKREVDSEMVRVKTEELNKATIDVKPARKVESNKMESNENFKIDTEDMYKTQKLEDPLEQIASAFCDRDGPLVSDFNKMVETKEVSGNDWDGFLQKKFRNMIDAGEVADDDFNGFLQKMHEREVAFREPARVAPKKARKSKDNAPKAAAKLRDKAS